MRPERLPQPLSRALRRAHHLSGREAEIHRLGPGRGACSAGPTQQQQNQARTRGLETEAHREKCARGVAGAAVCL